MNYKRLGLLVLASLLIVSSWLGIAGARSNLEVRSLQRAGVPLLYLAPQGARAVPGVLVAHGFAGSKQLMLGYGHVLAHAGYAVMLWDFNGHGANGARLQRDQLQQSLDVALAALLEQPQVDRDRLALLGHSMGSGIVMSAGVRSPDRFAATVAVSPTGANITPQTPRNLQLQAGGGEGRFIANAERLLAQAGGEDTNLAAGQGRELVVVPGVEHITILFSDGSHQAALRWLDATFERPSNSQYVDRRMGWYGLHLLGWLVGLAAVAPLFGQPRTTVKTSSIQRWLGLGVAPLTATAGLVLLGQRLNLQDLGGVQVGGAVGVWFLIAGLTWLAVLGRVPRPTLRTVGLGIVLFGVLWVAFGAMAQVVWLQWWLIPIRLRLWLPIAIACLPWFLASGVVQENIGVSKRILWWLGQTIILVGGFVLTLNFLPQLGFMYLLLPLFPPLMGVLALVAGSLNRSWVYAIGSALFFGWLLAAGFPLSA
ncbi:alpha/beta fold hydrolase [Pseudanabaena sp. FACHB-2040]|uniref:alpha/beta hydrolase family protein n=1 Tax=Pseudanabaena sp. FACHB-2040 TaxID=2692859 RepID=UPI0016869BE2|nr:alpha/beta fold hydrolase [Pseudanabaena sp. FACHB-2040]MBD2259386.1 alpha/beta fold hydrolase [Pseudanabaena sp. FACHB-2040]